MKTTLLLTGCLAAFVYLAPTAKAEDVDFAKQIFPIVKAKCLKCHSTEHEENGKVKKPKGGLIMDTLAGFKKGGKEKGDKFIVAGKPDESVMLKVVNLPSSDDDAMPPDGKGDPLTDAEKTLLKNWIAQGASFGSWKGAK
jgi:uncharacterized membrane protein